MLVPALLRTSLLLWLAQDTLQGGVKPQSLSWGRLLPTRGVGVGLKPGVTGALGALGSRYGNKGMKTGLGRYGALLADGGYRSLGLGGRGGAGLGGGTVPGLTFGLGQGGKRGFGAGLLPGYGSPAGFANPGPRQGFAGGAGNYLGAGLGLGGYGAGWGPGAYPGGAVGKLGAGAALGQSGYPQVGYPQGGYPQGGYPQGAAGISNGFGEGAAGYLGAVGGFGFGEGYGNGHSDGNGAGLIYPAELADGAENKAAKRKALSTGAYPGQAPGPYGALGAGLETVGGKYGGAQISSNPAIPSAPEGDGGFPFAAQQLGLGAEGAKAANKYGEQAGKYPGANDALGAGYRG